MVEASRPHGLPTSLVQHADAFSPPNGPNTHITCNTKTASPPDPSNNYKNFLAIQWSSTMQITNYNTSVFSALESTFKDAWPRGNHRSFSNHFPTIPTKPFPGSSSRPSLPTCAESTSGAFLNNFNMPSGVVHLKAKKQWKKGRTIISCYKSHYGPLLRVTSNVLNTMTYRLLPQSPGQLSIPQLWGISTSTSTARSRRSLHCE